MYQLGNVCSRGMLNYEKICTDTFDTLALSYKRSKMRVIIICFLTF